MIPYDLKLVRGLAFDVDGVLALPRVMLVPGGEPVRSADTKDGYALQLAVKMGLEVAVITGGRSPEVARRYEALGIGHVYMGVAVKTRCLDEWMAATGLSSEQVLYMGDDIPDYEVMRRVGCPCAPADAAEEVKAVSLYVSHRRGGEGCVRDVVEQVMRAQGLWMADGRAFGW